MNATIYRPEWTTERTEELTRLVRDGFSARQIAEVMGNGLTRSAVSGRISRLRIKTNDDTMRPGYSVGRTGKAFDGGRKKLTPEEKAARSRARWQVWERRNGGAVTMALKSRTKRSLRVAEARQMMRNNIVCCGEPKLIWDLVWCDCRWIVTQDAPISETYYCANVIEPGSSYCAAHARMAHDGRLPGQGFTKQPGVSPNWMTIRSGRRAA